MNQRIDEIDKQTWAEVAKLGRPVKWLDYRDKFAELIVRQCTDVLREESEKLYKLSAEEKDELFASNFEICAEKCVDNEVAIKEHFGVE